jgi:hypothetical protein
MLSWGFGVCALYYSTMHAGKCMRSRGSEKQHLPVLAVLPMPLPSVSDAAAAAALRSVAVAQDRAVAVELLSELRTRMDAESAARHCAKVTSRSCLNVSLQV